MTWAKTGSASNQNTTATSSLQTTGAFSAAVGDTVAVHVSWGISAGAPATCVVDDPAGKVTTFTLSPTATDSTNGEINCTAVGIVTSAGIPTPRVRWNPTPGTTIAQNASMVVDQFTGSDSSSTADGAGSGLLNTPAGAGTDNINSGSWSTATNGDLIVAGVTDSGTGNDTATTGTGFSAGTASTFVVVRSEWGTQTTAGSIAPTFNSTGAGSYLVTAMAVKPAAGAGTPAAQEPQYDIRQILQATIYRFGINVVPPALAGVPWIRAVRNAYEWIQSEVLQPPTNIIAQGAASSSGSAAGTTAEGTSNNPGITQGRWIDPRPRFAGTPFAIAYTQAINVIPYLLGSATPSTNTNAPGAGSSAGVATAVAIGQSTQNADASSTGVATGAAVGQSTQSADGQAAGVATGVAVGKSTQSADASSSGVATATAVGQAAVRADASSAGVATAIAVGRSNQSADASSGGVATATAVGQSSASADANSAGSAVGTVANSPSASGAGDASAAGSAAGTTAAGASLSSADASSSGVATAGAVGQSTQKADASSSGASTAAAVGQAAISADASSNGSAAGTVAVGTVLATNAGAASSDGVAGGTAVGASIVQAAASSTGDASGTVAASPTSSPVTPTIATAGTLVDGGGAVGQRWLQARKGKKARLERIEAVSYRDMLEMERLGLIEQAMELFEEEV